MTTEPQTRAARIVNLCPHPVRLQRTDGSIIVLPQHHQAARIRITPGPLIGEIDGVAIHGSPIYGDVINLPPPEEGTTFVVSQITALALSARGAPRSDIVFPGGGPHDSPHRDDKGRILAVTRLVRTS